MKTLHVYNVARLQQMELIPMLRETVSDTEKKAAVLLGTDAPLKRYLHNVKDGIDPFEVVTRNPQKDPYTQVLNEKDRLRDVAVSRFGRKLQYYEYAEKEAERKAFDALDALWAHHRSLPRLNVKKQTGATDNFLNDLTKEPYASAIATLGMQPEVDAVRATNDDYRAAAADRRATELVGANYSETDNFEEFSIPDNTSLVVVTGSTMDLDVIDEDEFNRRAHPCSRQSGRCQNC